MANATLVGLWQFEGGYADSSGSGNDGAAVGSVSLVPGQSGFGQAASFTGGNSHVLVADSDTLDLGTGSALTIAAWVNHSDPNWAHILAKAPGTGAQSNRPGNYSLRLNTGSKVSEFLYQNTTGDPNNFNPAGSSLTGTLANTWTHLAVTISTAGGVTYYLNGVPDGTDTVTDFGRTNNDPLYLGNRADFFTGLTGLLDDVAIFDEELSQSQIQTIGAGDFSAYVIPEPAASFLLALGGLVMGFRRRRLA